MFLAYLIKQALLVKKCSGYISNVKLGFPVRRRRFENPSAQQPFEKLELILRFSATVVDYKILPQKVTNKKGKTIYSCVALQNLSVVNSVN